MNYFLLVLATLASATKALVCKRIGTSGVSKRRILIENSLIFLFAATAVLIMSPTVGGVHISLKTFIISLVFAASLLFTQLMQMYAMRHGPASATTLIYSFGFLIPIVYGSIALDESISLPQIIGVFIVAISVFFITDPKTNKKTSKIWLCLSLLAALGSGLNAVIQKLHRSLTPENEISSLLVVSFAIASIFSFFISLVVKKEANSEIPIRSSIGFTAFSGIAIGTLNILNLLIAGRLPAVIQFPTYNVGAMILVGVCAKVLFNDRLSKKQTAGFVIGMISILIIGLF